MGRFIILYLKKPYICILIRSIDTSMKCYLPWVVRCWEEEGFTGLGEAEDDVRSGRVAAMQDTFDSLRGELLKRK